MFQLIKETHIPFTRLRYFGYAFSGALALMTLVVLLVNRGPNYSIDFLGGSNIALEFSKPLSTAEIRSVVTDLGEAEVKIFRVQEVATGKVAYQIQVPPHTSQVEQKSFAQSLVGAFQKRYPDIKVTVTGEENVSPAFGKELQWKAILALLIGLALILVYLGVRIDFKFSVGTVLAVFHDVWVVLGIITLIGIRIDVTVIAAFLTIIGYSVNDSIVVSERIQELIKLRRGVPLAENIDTGINETLSRTVITGMTTLFVALAIVIIASGTGISAFAMTMILGIVVGTYSSIFIVTPTVLEWERIFPSRKRRV